MTSAINPDLINGAFPIAGQDNSSQGFRDNFTNTKENFLTAYNEITDLQSKVLLASPLTDGTFNNDMQGNLLANPKLQGVRELIYNIGSVSGTANVDFSTGLYQSMTLSGSTTINNLANFTGTSGSFAKIKLAVTVTNAYNTLTFPTTVNIANASISGFNTSTRTITFDGPGTYLYELSTINGGSSFLIQDLTNNRDTVPGGNFTVTTNYYGSAVAGITMTVANVAGSLVGNIYANNVIVANSIITSGTGASYTGNITGNYVIANLGLVGTLSTSAQPNITSLGNLTTLTVTGNASIGNITANGKTDMCGGTIYGVHYVNIGNGGSETIYSNVGVAIINFTSNIAGCSLTMPTAASNGQSIKIGFTNNTCTTLTHVASGQTLLAPLTTANQYAGGEWVYYTTTSTWHKVS